MDWQNMIVRRTLEGAGDETGAQLEFLLTRLEAHPEALPAIIAAIEDMAEFLDRKANAIHAEMARREARDRLAEIVKTKK